jgi:hypothetical protein
MTALERSISRIKHDRVDLTGAIMRNRDSTAQPLGPSAP